MIHQVEAVLMMISLIIAGIQSMETQYDPYEMEEYIEGMDWGKLPANFLKNFFKVHVIIGILGAVVFLGIKFKVLWAWLGGL